MKTQWKKSANITSSISRIGRTTTLLKRLSQSWKMNCAPRLVGRRTVLVSERVGSNRRRAGDCPPYHLGYDLAQRTFACLVGGGSAWIPIPVRIWRKKSASITSPIFRIGRTTTLLKRLSRNWKMICVRQLAGRARHSVRAVVVSPNAFVSRGGAHGVTRPTILGAFPAKGRVGSVLVRGWKAATRYSIT
jgi:hypothetical protein